MRVIVVDGNSIDLLQQAVVDFLNVRARERGRLRGRCGCPREGHEQSSAKMNQTFHFSQSPVSSWLLYNHRKITNQRKTAARQ